MIHVVEARTPEEREGIFALRYRVYVDEMGRAQQHADHGRRLLQEPEDADARLLLARGASGEVLGTARVHLGRRVPSALESMYQMQRFQPFHPTQTSVTTKLMVEARYRRGPLALRLAQACYDLGFAAGVRFNFIDCNAHLRSFFLQLGFRQVFPDFVHPIYGCVSPLVLALRDVEYLRSIGSLFALPDSDASDPSVAFFNDLLENSSQPVEST